MITLATYGVGMLIGFWVAGWAYDTYEMSDKVHDWKTIWLIPSGIAVLVALIFAVAFKQKKTTPVEA